MHNLAMKMKSVAPQRLFMCGKNRNWWDNRSSKNPHRVKAEIFDQSAPLNRYLRICQVFGFAPENPHREILMELARENGFERLDHWASNIVNACECIQSLATKGLDKKPEQQGENTAGAEYGIDEINRVDARQVMITIDECYEDMHRNFFKNPVNAKTILAELPAFLQILPFLEKHVIVNGYRFWIALKGFSQDLSLEHAAHLAFCHCQSTLFNDSGIGAAGAASLTPYLKGTDKTLKMLASLSIACDSVVGAWMVHTGRMKLSMAKHIGQYITTTDWLFMKAPINNPVFLNLPPEIATKLCCGVKPVELTNGLNKQEAHQWLMYMAQQGEITPESWLAQHLGVNPHYVLPATTFTKRTSTDVIRWLAKKQNTAAFKVFTKVFVYGRVKEVSFSAYLDEICKEDLINGLETSPAVALKAARIRQAKQRAQSYGRSLDLEKAFPDPELPVVNGITRIEDVEQLIDEGVSMGHCVGSVNYQIRCAAGENAVYSVTTTEGRSTLQLAKQDTRWHVMQHLGPLNTTPERANLDLVAKWVKTLGNDKVVNRPAVKVGGIVDLYHQAQGWARRNQHDVDVFLNACEQNLPQIEQPRAQDLDIACNALARPLPHVMQQRV